MARARSLETVVTHGLCAGCGLCESLAGRARIEMTPTSQGQIRPRIKQPLAARLLDDILKVCPGVGVTGPAADQAGPSGRLHPLFGPIASLDRGWASDETRRRHAAAGGALTALGCFLLDSGRVEAVLHIRAAAAEPLLSEALVSRTAEEVVSGAQSRYGPAAPLTEVHRLLDAGTTFAVIAKPCDVAAIRNLARLDPRVAEQVPYCLSIFCGGVPSLHTAKKIAAYLGLAAEEVARFGWRGEGWPGPTQVERHDGRVFRLSYDQVWYDTSVPWSYDIQFRCKICPDAIGELADVACPDGWVLEDGRPVHKEAPGVNLLLARTPRGAELVQAAAAAGVLELAPCSEAELEAMHGDHRPRKAGWPTRLLALTLTGQPALRVRRFRRTAALLAAGPLHGWHGLWGMARRVARRANREPLI